MMTKYECAQQFLKLESLPPKQLDNLEVLERQILDVGLRFYTGKIVNLDDLSLEGAKEKLKELASQVHFLAKMLLVAGCDIHHFRAVSLAHFIEVPPEMQIDDIISRLTTRGSDVSHDDTEDVALFGETTNTENGKEEGKEKIPPHPPIEKRAEEKEKDLSVSARACEDGCEGDDDVGLTEEEKEQFKTFFDEFWRNYPVGRKIAKKLCRTKLRSRFKRLKNKERFCVDVLAGLEAWKNGQRWLDGYVCNPETFINQERWKDDPPKTCSGHRKVSGVSQTANVKSNRAKGLW